jgi:hypothetical protein
VLCVRIGRKPRDELRKNGINQIEAPYFIHEALKSILLIQFNLKAVV